MGHHLRVIESLEYTLTTQSDTAREKWVRKIKSHSQKRNTSSYDLADGVSPTDLAQIMKDLPILQEQVRAWLKEVHPELLKDASSKVGSCLQSALSASAIRTASTPN